MTAETHCSFCGHPGPFEPVCPGGSLRETRCALCGSARRNRDLMRVLLDEGGGDCGQLFWLRIYELQARGPLHDLLAPYPYYECSEFLPNVLPGLRSGQGVRCEDATRLTFADNSFHIVISQDVLEHIEDTWKVFTEINRVLVPGGKHIFTVPLHEGRKTSSRAGKHPLWHGDPLKPEGAPEGALVHWDFGDDLPGRLAELGIQARLASLEAFYPADEICRVESGEDYARYQGFMARKERACFFLYNSAVFVAQKPVLKL